MTFSQVLGQGRAIDALRTALQGGSLHHAYLFAGPDGVGKERTALALAQALLCERAQGEGCGACDSCVRVAKLSHPDVTWLMPEEELVARKLAAKTDFAHAPSRDIRVEQVRGLQERLALRALEGKRKVAVLTPAHAMNPQAQNAFLKTLEEPPADTVLVLVTSQLDKLLPTIRSRCSQLHFGPLPEALIRERLQAERKLDPAAAAMVASMAEGSLGRAIAFDLELLERRKALVEALEGLSRADARGWLHFAESFGASREVADESLQMLTWWLRDLASIREKGTVPGGDGLRLINVDLAAAVEQGAAKVRSDELHRRIQLVEQARIAISSRNGAPRLQLERMLIEMLA